MKQLYKISLRHSFVTKVCIWMLVSSACVFLACFGAASWCASKGMLNDGHQKANLELDKAIIYIVNEKNVIENAGNNFATMWNGDSHVKPEEVYGLFKEFLKKNPSVKGVAIGFEPDQYPERPKGFTPFVMRKAGGGFTQADVSGPYDTYSRPWYVNTKAKGKPRWSNPFIGVNGNTICSYCIPLYKPGHRLTGVLAVDISLDELTEKVQSIKPYPTSYITIMDRHLNFLVHPDKSLILKGNPMLLADKNQYEANESIYVDIKNRVRGQGAFREDGRQKYLYYAPVKGMGWTVTLQYDESEIVAGVKTMRREMMAIFTIGIVGLLFICLFLMRRFLRPVKLYAKAALRIAEGHFDTPMPHIRSHNELWALGHSLNHMQQSLAQYIQQLKATTQEKARIESELTIASNIQMSMIPKTFPPYPDRDDVDIYATLIPAKAVGGDLYDFFLRDEKLFFCIGDVSGKGVPASLVMAVTRSLLRIVAVHENRPEHIVASLNNSMSDMNESNMFVTLFVGVLDLPTGRLRYCNAGHNAPMLIGERAHQAKPLDVKPNIPIAIVPGMTFEAQQAVLQPGTTLFMYTDGLTEAENGRKELFGEQRMTRVLADESHTTSRQRIDAMLDAVHQHVGQAEQSDDLTMLAVKYKRRQCDTTCHRRLTLRNDTRETPKIATLIDDMAGEAGIDATLADSLNLALEEAVVNVMNYAYPQGQTGCIHIEASADKRRIQFVITDSGAPFNPTTDTAEPDITAGIEQRAVGGLGVFLVKQIMDEMTYRRADGQNILTLTKHIGAQSDNSTKK